MRRYGIFVLNGYLATTADEAEAAAKKLGGCDVVIKAQVLAGGRAKGIFENGFKGGVRIAYSPTEAYDLAAQMIGQMLVTKQTGEARKICNSVYIVEQKYIRKEYYLAILMDRTFQSPLVVASSQGGVDIETVAKETPDAIITQPINIIEGVSDSIANSIAIKMGFKDNMINKAADTIKKLSKIFIERDATQIEINPMAESSDGEIMCMDSKFSFDDNAEFRQKEIFSKRDFSQENPSEVKAAELGLNFIKLDGNIGCLVNGAGLAMATLDIVQLFGGKPANFLDCGGGATAKAIEEAFSIITSDIKVSVIFCQ